MASDHGLVELRARTLTFSDGRIVSTPHRTSVRLGQPRSVLAVCHGTTVSEDQIYLLSSDCLRNLRSFYLLSFW
jgi:hypothetical protein